MSRILLVEDDDDHVALAGKVFDRHGVGKEVHVVRSGEAAVEFLFERDGVKDIRLIFLDLQLPKMSGVDLLSRLKQDPKAKGIPVVVVTISRKEHDLMQCFSMGVSDYILKPFEYEKFAAIYDRLMKAPPV